MSDLDARAKRMLRTKEPFRLTGKLRSIHFLRGVFSRSSMSLPGFYYFLGSASTYESIESTNDYTLKVAQAYSEFSDLNTLTLACRKVFDHSVKTDLTGANFGKTSDGVITEHARYWADRSGKPEDDCTNALLFLREFFGEYSKTDNVLLKHDGYLHKRIGLLKQHADRAAAHLSLENYSLDILDVAHFTAAVTIIGEVIRSFDSPSLGDEYFNNVDKASFQAARKIFPKMRDFRLFSTMKVCDQARF
jgi:hypothetical protein